MMKIIHDDYTGLYRILTGWWQDRQKTEDRNRQTVMTGGRSGAQLVSISSLPYPTTERIRKTRQGSGEKAGEKELSDCGGSWKAGKEKQADLPHAQLVCASVTRRGGEPLGGLTWLTTWQLAHQ